VDTGVRVKQYSEDSLTRSLASSFAPTCLVVAPVGLTARRRFAVRDSRLSGACATLPAAVVSMWEGAD